MGMGKRILGLLAFTFVAFGFASTASAALNRYDCGEYLYQANARPLQWSVHRRVPALSVGAQFHYIYNYTDNATYSRAANLLSEGDETNIDSLAKRLERNASGEVTGFSLMIEGEYRLCRHYDSFGV